MSLFLMILAAAAPPAATAAAPARQPDAAPLATASTEPAKTESGVIAYPPSFFADIHPTNAYDMVIRLPGFTFDRGFNSERGAAVRGLEGAGGNVLIDGHPPLSKNDSLDEVLRRIPAATVARIEVIRGSVQGIDMEGRTVVANVVRRSQTSGFQAAAQPYFAALYDGRFFPGVRLEQQWALPGGRTLELSETVSTGHFPNDEFGDGGRIRYAGAAGARLIDSKIDADSGGSRFGGSFAFSTPFAGGRLSLSGAAQKNSGGLELYDTERRTGVVEYEKSPNIRTQYEAGARFGRTLTPKVSLEALVFQQFFIQDQRSRFESPTLTRTFALDRKSGESVGRVQLNVAASPTFKIEAGAEGAYNRLNSKTTLAINSRPVALPAGNVIVEELRGNGFARATWRVSPALSLEAGFREEVTRVTSAGDVTLRKPLQFFKPRAALTWAAAPTTQVRLRVEREVGQINFDDFVASPQVANTGTVVAGNPDLTPQQAWVYEAAVEQRFWKDGSLVLTARRFDLSDVVDRLPLRNAAGVILADAPGNIGSGQKTEIQVGLTAPLDRLGIKAAQLKGQVTWRDTRVIDPLGLGSRQISSLHPIDWEAHFSQAVRSLGVTWGLDLVGGIRERVFRLTEVETRKISPFLTVFVERRLAPDTTLRVEAVGVNFRNARRIREVYAGPRSTSALTFTDVRDLELGPDLSVRLRKTFGR